MRVARLFPLILLHSLTATAAEVVIQPQMTTLSPTAKHLRESCGAGGVYDACTRFVAYRLRATCTPEGQSWRIQAAATFRPWVFLRNMHSLTHEQEHVRDVRHSVEAHLGMLESMTFTSEAACQQTAFTEMGGFGARMRDFAAQSNAERHPLTHRGNASFTPPSTGNIAPVVLADLGPARKSAASATSAAVTSVLSSVRLR